ncbi:MAG TPA: LysM peptidoglycan-binding domain-containing protein [Patescibacteria group bacterium]|jgi:hypothetical protein|nr:LysM peptidoglycan-binding domain-containing protein [Patescibacteria group bacterium]
MTKRNHSSALTGLVLAAMILVAPASLARARQEQTPEQERAAQQQEKSAEQSSADARADARARATAPSSTHPPRTGRFVGTHWTPYEPPSVESFPQGSKVHIIEKGDTLWDLAGKYLQDPYLWPQIWDVNQYITDSHWIYPGDPLLIPGRPTVIGEKGPEPAIEMLEPPAGESTGGQAATTEPSPTPVMTGAPVLSPAAGESDIYCSNFIVDSFTKPDLTIREREEGTRTLLSTGDIVFLNHGMDSNITTGDEFTVVVDEGMIPHPVFSEDVGQGVRMVGRVRVIALQETTATAEIVQACQGIEVGMPLIPYEEIPVPLAMPASFRRYGADVQTDNAGYIVTVTPTRFNIGEGDIINIDMGSDNGLRPGDVLTVFREWGGPVKFDSSESFIAGTQVRAARGRVDGKIRPGDLPQVMLGQIVVLRTEKHTSMAKVVMSVRELGLGDRVAAR